MLSSRLDTNLRRTMKRFLTHTYTWIDNDKVPVLEDGEPTYDEYGNQVFTDADAVEDKPCLFLFEEIVSNTATGAIASKVPTLYVLSDDEVASKDVISNVRDRSGTVILESAFVESVDPTSEVNNSALRVLRLSGAETV